MFFSMSLDEWKAVIDVHLDGTFYVSRAAAPHFKSRQSGAYVHMTSTSGLIGNLGQANYGAAKLGIVALFYRLSGDYNALHAERVLARAAGFERPILHGLASYGIVGFAVTRAAAGGDPTRIGSFETRFSSPVLPSETIRTEFWIDGSTVSFRARVLERDVIVLNNGRATLR